MSLNTATLQQDLVDIFNNMTTQEDREYAIGLLATNIAQAVDAYIKTAEVNVNVITTGSPTNHTGTGVGTIS